jgi:hypothetical protein
MLFLPKLALYHIVESSERVSGKPASLSNCYKPYNNPYINFNFYSSLSRKIVQSSLLRTDFFPSIWLVSLKNTAVWLASSKNTAIWLGNQKSVLSSYDCKEFETLIKIKL